MRSSTFACDAVAARVILAIAALVAWVGASTGWAAPPFVLEGQTQELNELIMADDADAAQKGAATLYWVLELLGGE